MNRPKPIPGARVSPPATTPSAHNPGKNTSSPRGWHSRGYLPHCDGAYLHQTITYRLIDSLPTAVAERLASEIGSAEADAAYRQRVEAYLDAGHGECWLRRPEIARTVLDSWRYFDGQRYGLCAWVVMPNHVHVLVAIAETSLSDVVKGWKSVTARRINALLGQTGSVWQEEYWDRYIRDEKHYADAVSYIHQNPVTAGLVARPEDWPWSSASRVPPPA